MIRKKPGIYCRLLFLTCNMFRKRWVHMFETSIETKVQTWLVCWLFKKSSAVIAYVRMKILNQSNIKITISLIGRVFAFFFDIGKHLDCFLITSTVHSSRFGQCFILWGLNSSLRGINPLINFSQYYLSYFRFTFFKYKLFFT